MNDRILVVVALFVALGCNKKNGGSIAPQVDPPVQTGFVRGADISWVTEMESAGMKFYNSAGAQKECMELMKSLGMNAIRLRVWVNPTPSWNNGADVVAKALRAKKLGLRVMIDFHYSDTWADPGKQTKPTAWESMDFNSLKTALASHTTDVLTQLKAAGVQPEWVQVGNETNNGMLWPDGRASTSMSNFAQLVNAGHDAVKGVFPAAKVIVHISNGWDNSLFRWMFDGLKANGAKYDVIGMSLYPSYTPSGWQTANQQCLQNMNDMVTRYNKEVMIVEVGMPWDDAANCNQFIADLMVKVKSVPGEKGLGVMYWEPQAYRQWKGYTLGAFDNAGKPTVALNPFAN